MNEDRSDKFTLSPTGTVMTQCTYCKHLIAGAFGSGCGAFPSAIPDEIMLNRFDHRRTYPDGQESPITFEPRPDVPTPVLTQLYDRLDKLR